MVYFKLTPSLVDLVKQARLEGLVGCQRKEELLSTTDAETRKQLELMEFMRSTAGSMSQSGNGGPYSKLNKDELENYQEPVTPLGPSNQHCRSQIARSTIYNLINEWGCDGQFKKVRLAGRLDFNSLGAQGIGKDWVSIRALRASKLDPQARHYSAYVIIQNLSPLDPSDDHDFKAKQEFRFTIAFGFGFITLMFLSFVCGYFMGKKVLGLSETQSLIMSLIIGVGTIILETVLFVIRMEKMDANARKADLAKSKSQAQAEKYRGAPHL